MKTLPVAPAWRLALQSVCDMKVFPQQLDASLVNTYSTLTIRRGWVALDVLTTIKYNASSLHITVALRGTNLQFASIPLFPSMSTEVTPMILWSWTFVLSCAGVAIPFR